jgi:hypothetical protein
VSVLLLPASLPPLSMGLVEGVAVGLARIAVVGMAVVSNDNSSASVVVVVVVVLVVVLVLGVGVVSVVGGLCAGVRGGCRATDKRWGNEEERAFLTEGGAGAADSCISRIMPSG